MNRLLNHDQLGSPHGISIVAVSYLLAMHTFSFSATNAQMLLFKFAAAAFAMGCSMRHHCW
jgi:hypothetical protein